MYIIRPCLAILLAASLTSLPSLALDQGDLEKLLKSLDTTIAGDGDQALFGFSQRRMFVPNAPPNPPVKDNGASAELLLRKIKRSPYDYGFDRRGRILAQRGGAVLPALIDELRGSRDYYRICLINIMGAIPSRERDSAFLEQLETMIVEKHDFLLDSAAKPLIQTLAASAVKEAIPLLNQFLNREGIRESTRAEARIALVQLGALDLAALATPCLELAPDLSRSADDVHMVLLDALMKYGLLETPSQLRGVMLHQDGHVQLDGNLDGGTWHLKFGPEQSSRIPFYYTFYKGPMHAEGYYGVFEKANDQWILTFWRMAWIS